LDIERGERWDIEIGGGGDEGEDVEEEEGGGEVVISLRKRKLFLREILCNCQVQVLSFHVRV
jgi:hypothetical protein